MTIKTKGRRTFRSATMLLFDVWQKYNLIPGFSKIYLRSSFPRCVLEKQTPSSLEMLYLVWQMNKTKNSTNILKRVMDISSQIHDHFIPSNAKQLLPSFSAINNLRNNLQANYINITQAVFNSVQIRQWNSNTTFSLHLKSVDYTYGRNVCHIKKINSHVAARINMLGIFLLIVNTHNQLDVFIDKGLHAH